MNVLDRDLQVVDDALHDFAEVALFLLALHFQLLLERRDHGLREAHQPRVLALEHVVLELVPAFWLPPPLLEGEMTT